MRRTEHSVKKLLSLFVVLMLVIYAVIGFLPHDHDCIETDCVICEIIDFTRNILLVFLLLTIIHNVPKVFFILPVSYVRIIPYCSRTPVGLKVKLLD